MKRARRQQQRDVEPEGRGRMVRRRAARDIDKLVLQLIELTEAEIFDLPVSQELRQELNTAREIRSRGARRRQLRFVSGMLRASEPELTAIRKFLDTGARPRFDPLADVRHIEQMRADLCEPERFSATLDRICQDMPLLDRATIADLARTVHDNGDDDKAYRELYRRLRTAVDAADADADADADD